MDIIVVSTFERFFKRNCLMTMEKTLQKFVPCLDASLRIFRKSLYLVDNRFWDGWKDGWMKAELL